MRKYEFYYKELLLSLKQPLPAIGVSVLLVILILLVVWITKKIVNRSWEKEPEKLDKLIKMKIQILSKKIHYYKMNIKKLKQENIALQNYIRGIRSYINGANIKE